MPAQTNRKPGETKPSENKPAPKTSEEKSLLAEAEKWEKEADKERPPSHDSVKFALKKIATAFRAAAQGIHQFDRTNERDPDDRTAERKEE